MGAGAVHLQTNFRKTAGTIEEGVAVLLGSLMGNFFGINLRAVKHPRPAQKTSISKLKTETAAPNQRKS